jgi:hypothetical protein
MNIQTNYNRSIWKNNCKIKDGSFGKTKYYADNTIGVLGSMWIHHRIFTFLGLFLISREYIMGLLKTRDYRREMVRNNKC